MSTAWIRGADDDEFYLKNKLVHTIFTIGFQEILETSKIVCTFQNASNMASIVIFDKIRVTGSKNNVLARYRRNRRHTITESNHNSLKK